MESAEAFAHAAAVDSLCPGLAAALAEELVALTVRLSELAYALGNDPHTLRQHMTSLQAIDSITQAQLAIAEILRSNAPVAERIAATSLESLADRLTAAILGKQRASSSSSPSASSQSNEADVLWECAPHQPQEDAAAIGADHRNCG